MNAICFIGFFGKFTIMLEEEVAPDFSAGEASASASRESSQSSGHDESHNSTEEEFL